MSATKCTGNRWSPPQRWAPSYLASIVVGAIGLVLTAVFGQGQALPLQHIDIPRLAVFGQHFAGGAADFVVVVLGEVLHGRNDIGLIFTR